MENNYTVDIAEEEIEIPNEITIAAIKECEEMMKHPERYKTYKDIDEMIADIFAEE